MRSQRSQRSPLDVAGSFMDDETEVEAHTGCPAGIDTRLWRGVGSGHILIYASTIVPSGFVDWLRAHPKP